jgi:symplekin
LNAILNFNPLKLANSPMTPKARVVAKSMEKTTRALLIHIHKRYAPQDHGSLGIGTNQCSDPQGPDAARIEQKIRQLMQLRSELFDDTAKKRGPPEPTDGLDAAKRQKLNAAITAPPVKLYIPPLGPGQHTIGDLYTITQEQGLKDFDVSQLPHDLVTTIVVKIMAQVDANLLNQAITV